ncbi:MAG: ECF transporter S component [Candidatus Thorarchaeota archaeon]|nr:ECF transporter S component [Candidatus Thorarchaeota archaeon]
MTLQSNQSITTRDIVTIAILGSLGGALSTFVGYLGNLVNLALGVPFGAGQFMAGLHVFWLVLIRAIVPRHGVGTAGGLLKGMVELFTGSTHGIAIVFVSLAQGIVVDVGAFAAGSIKNLGDNSRIIWWLSAGVSASANVIVLQMLYFTGAPFIYIGVITILAFCSGVIFAGYFAWETLEFLNDAGSITGFQSRRSTIPMRNPKTLLRRNVPAVLFIIILTVSTVYYTTNVAQAFADPFACEVKGLVQNPFTFRLSDFAGSEVTIEAELIGAYTHLPPANYTGVLLLTILQIANPNPEASGLAVSARDGYSVRFEDLDAIMNDYNMLLTSTSDGLWLIADNYDGSLWVRQVTTLAIY